MPMTTGEDDQDNADSFWADFEYDWDGEDPFQEYGADYSEGD